MIEAATLSNSAIGLSEPADMFSPDHYKAMRRPLAEAETLPDAPPAPGVSLVPVLTKDGSIKHDVLWWFHDGHKAVRKGDWKAVAPVGEPWELYNLANDRDESTDLAISQKDRLTELVAEWDRHLAAFVELTDGR